MPFVRVLLFVVFCLVLTACGEDAPEQEAQKPQVSTPAASQPVASQQQVPADITAGDVFVQILPENPTSTGCLRAVIKGTPGRGAVLWLVNGSLITQGADTQLCSDNYNRNDTVTVKVGTSDQGAQASVSIGNTPPQVVDISSTPDEIFAGTDVTVLPVAEDADGDEVEFTYQWLINGEEVPVLTDATLPGSSFSKGETIQVLIVPNDFYDDGPTYESYAQVVPNAAPTITSEPPQGITSLDYRYQVEVSDPDDSQFTYRLDEAPEGMEIDAASGLLRWSLADVAPGDYTIAIIVTDPEGAEGAQEYNLSLGAPQ